MKEFIKQLIFFLLSTILIFCVGLIVIDKYLNRKEFYKVDNSISYLILGNSHSECALNDSLINHSINLSNSADSYFYTYYKLIKITKENSNIKTVLLEYTNNAFDEKMNDWIYDEKYLVEKYSKYSQSISIDDAIFLFYKNPYGYFRALKKATIDKLKSLTVANLLVYNEFKWGSYLFLDKVILLCENKRTKRTNEIKIRSSKSMKSLNILYLNKIVKYCKDDNINLILIRSPLHKFNNKEHEVQFANLLNRDLSGIKFWDYCDFSLDDCEFGDLEHLYFKGAIKFSKQLNLRLNKQNKLNIFKD